VWIFGDHPVIIGIGTDIVKITRFEGMATHFMERVFTPDERVFLGCEASAGMSEKAAGMFAAKEAVAKALGTGFRGFWPCDVEVCHDGLGKPYVKLHNKARRVLRSKYRIHISISHTDTDAIAFAVISR
jgi:holo-[acyl-carrier protein] synthase